MLTIILAESELELIPDEIVMHPTIVSYAKQRNKKPRAIILDSSYHHKAMQKLSEGNRRGRPDIIHIFLLTALESIINKIGNLRIIIHTRNNEAINVNSETRIIRNYPRFIGLIEQLFVKKKITTDGKTLIEIFKNKPLEKIIKEEKYDHLIIFSFKGKKVKLSSYFKNLKEKNFKNILCIIGGFPHGDFHFDFSKFSNEMVSIFNDHLTVWTVTNEILVNYENAYL